MQATGPIRAPAVGPAAPASDNDGVTIARSLLLFLLAAVAEIGGAIIMYAPRP